MPKLVAIQNHLTVEQLEQRYRYAREATQKIHDQVIWLLASGHTCLECNNRLQSKLDISIGTSVQHSWSRGIRRPKKKILGANHYWRI